MRLFSARLDINYSIYVSEGLYKLEARIVDNTGLYAASSVQVGDIIYVSGLDYGQDIFRYQVAEIISAKGVTLVANVRWDMPFSQDIDPVEPSGDAIIGARHTNSTTANMVDTSINQANEKLVSDARNYQQILTNEYIMTNSSSTPDKAFVFEQNEPSKKWIIDHPLEKHPSITVVDTEGVLVQGDVQYVDDDTIEVTFSTAFAGKAYLN